jgi:hypothetical protein
VAVPKFATRVPRNDANFGLGTLVAPDARRRHMFADTRSGLRRRRSLA